MQLFYTLIPSSFGWFGIVKGPRGLKRVLLPADGRPEIADHIRHFYPDAIPGDGCCKQEADQLRAYFQGKRLQCRAVLDFSGATPFQRTVWKLTAAIPYGSLGTYLLIATQAGSPKAARAVGSALGKNPFPVFIPCHRVVRQDGLMGGFSAPRGTWLKARLLRLEGISTTEKRVSSAGKSRQPFIHH